VSVVMIDSEPERALESVAAALGARRDGGVEVVVVCQDGPPTTAWESRAGSAVKVVSISGPTSTRAMRRAGMAAAGGDVVVFADAREGISVDAIRLLTLPEAASALDGSGAFTLSVIVPAHQASSVLHRCLQALGASRHPRSDWELVVVDDASTDDTELIAAEYADTVVRLAGNPHGPAYARNRGAEVSRGGVFVFVDADVLVHPDALTRFARLFDAEPALGAAFGRYDAEPAAQGLVSQYRNLMHHYVHSANPGPSETFWAGLGAVRRAAFWGVGGFDEWGFSRPQIEDIELGRRLRALGCRIRLVPEIEGTHLKRWTLRQMFVTDFMSRGVPWMWLLLREGQSAGGQTLNLGMVGRLSTGLIGIALVALMVGIVTGSPWALRSLGAAVLLTIALNLRFYAFLTRRRGLWFGLAAVPLHLGYYVSNVFAVVVGWLAYVFLGDPIPPAASHALAQVGVKTWPPAPRQKETTQKPGSDAYNG